MGTIYSAGYEAGTPKTYSTLTAAIAVCDDDSEDHVAAWEGDAYGSPVFRELFYTTKHIGLLGMLGYQRVILNGVTASNGSALLLDQGESAKTGTVSIKNITVAGAHSDNSRAITYTNTAAGNTGKVIVERCVVVGCGFGVLVGSYAQADVRYCAAYTCGVGFRASSSDIAVRFANCSALACENGFAGVSTYAFSYNCVSFGSRLADFSGLWAVGTNYNRSGDSTVIGASSSGSHTWEELKFAMRGTALDNRLYGYTAFDARPTVGSILIGTGNAVAGLTDTTDIDGQGITTQPIGCSVGVVAFPTPRIMSQYDRVGGSELTI